ncbi:MAG TPA: FtsX-like permease family protein [Myxococcaceae bacterium]|nr:FtsX-like permease family protein [Myxococcaceae bacterium]
MPSLTRVAVRNVLSTPRRALITSGAVIVGCTAIVFMVGMNLGFAEMEVSNAVGLMLGHVQVDSARGARTVPAGPVLAAAAEVAEVAGAAPRLEIPALAGAPGQARGAMLLGVDAEREASTSLFPRLVVDGKLPGANDGDAVALGAPLAEQLHVKVGDQVPIGFLTLSDDLGRARLRVVGLVRSGSEDLDPRLALVSIATARRLYESPPDGTGKVVIKARANAETDAAAGALRGRLDPGVYRVRTWREVSPFLRGLVSFQYGSVNVVLVILYVIVGLSVAAVQVIGILQRTREFGVLSAIGFTPSRVLRLVALETLLVGTVAVGIGLVLGVAVTALVNRLGGIDVRWAGAENLEGMIGVDPYLRPLVSRYGLAMAAGLVAPILGLGGVLPALRAARMIAMDVLRY